MFRGMPRVRRQRFTILGTYMYVGLVRNEILTLQRSLNIFSRISSRGYIECLTQSLYQCIDCCPCFKPDSDHV